MVIIIMYNNMIPTLKLAIWVAWYCIKGYMMTMHIKAQKALIELRLLLFSSKQLNPYLVPPSPHHLLTLPIVPYMKERE
jgi:hypothetical protein